ncbi:MAG TPA: BlaB/IND/MUS family subclass B1 metallo-beta-lactamase [Chitinophagales bacterium]|nr:BlaB/IND/MUS family subclass B1 metallo-beta-lactamase [Chitinophagales bacterium]
MKNIITALLLFTTCLLFAQKGPKPLTIKPLTGNFYVYTTYHLYKGVPVSANGMYLAAGEGVLMFDTPWDTTQFQPLLDSIWTRHHKKVIACIATHSHEDRTGGFDYYNSKGIQTYATAQTDSICKQRGEKRAQYLIPYDSGFGIGDYSCDIYYPGPGHAPDNIVLWFPSERILYGGCFIKSTDATDLGYTGDADLKEWPLAIKRVQEKFGKPNYVIPGHGNWRNKKSPEHTLRLLRKHRN